MKPDRTEGGERAWGYLAVFVLALAVRLLHLAEIHDSTLFTVLLGDGREYVAWAERIAQGDWWGDEVFYQAPLYPYLVAVVLRVGGSPLWPLRLLQALFGAGASALLVGVGRRFFSYRIGLVAGLLLAVYPPAVFFDGVVQKTSLANFLNVLLLCLVGLLLTKSSSRLVFALGLVLGLLVLTRENALLFGPVIALWLVLPRARASDWRRLVPLGLGLACVLVPVALRNLSVGGEFLPTTSQLGPNLFIGNHRGANGVYEPLRPGREDARVERHDASALAQEAVGRPLSRGEVSAYWRGRTRDEIRADPAAWLGLLARKTRLLAHARELVDTESLEAYSEHSRVLGALDGWLHFGIVGPLAVLGLWATREQWRRLWILYALGAATAASVVLFYVLARYRFPLVPLVLLFAAAGLAELVRLARRREPLAWLGALGLLATAALAQNGSLPLASRPRATTYYNLGVAAFELGRDDEAVEYLERSLALLPDLAVGHAALGRARAATGDLEAAIESRRRALELRADLPTVRTELAESLVDRERWPEAAEHYRIVLAEQPDEASIQMKLGFVLARMGSFEEAALHLEKAVTIDPNLALAHNLLGNLRAQQVRLDEAIESYERALEIDPGLSDAHFKLGLVRAERGEYELALQHLNEARRLLPEFAPLHREIAGVLELAGRPAEAEQSRRRAVELEERSTSPGR